LSGEGPFRDPGARERRRVPPVTEVVDAVAGALGIPPEHRAELFRAAQQVCAEELRLTRTGFAPASLDELADRAARLLPSTLGGERVPLRGWSEEAPFPEEPFDEIEPVSLPGDPFGGEPVEPAGAPDRGFVYSARAPAEIPGEAGPGSDPGEPRRAEESAAPEEGESPEEIEFATVGEPGPPARGGKLVTFLLLVAIAGGVWFFARTKRAPTPPASPESGALAPPAVFPPPADTSTAAAEAPGSSAPSGSSTPAPAVPPASAQAGAPGTGSSGEPATSPIPESRGSSMISPDWSGRSPAWMIHFSSYQRKENADRDAARLAKVVGRPLRVIEINLGKPGAWYRVMLGDYASRDEAQAARDALAAKGVAGVGLVYRVAAP